ncbi:hypothetical protein B0H17DRAFT_1199069 [Mycena rosella]|uniref:Uncharacterized protein n=1 Tax=Mycena rosella TaxID=1033263 RepID=A0AAD7DM28_MYCRO|nr:hypothetical protein B0H17DRAFT_1199069 [Mycena rosella]
MPTPTPIPRPDWAPSRISGTNARDMADVMSWKQEDFVKLKEHVQAKAAALQLDTYAGPPAQDPAKWRELVADCVKAFPALKDFARRWPVEFYYTQYTHWRRLERNKRLRSQNAQQPAPTKGPDSSAQRPGKRKGGPDAGKENVDEPRIAPRATQSGSQSNSGAQFPRSRPPTQREKERLNDRTETNIDSQRQSGAQAAHSGAATQPGKGKLSERTPTNIQQSSSQHSSASQGTPPQPPTRPENERISTHTKESGSQRYSGSQDAPSTSFTQSDGKLLATRRNEFSSTTRREYSLSSRQMSANTSAPSSSPRFPGSSSAPRHSQPTTHHASWSACTTELRLLFKGRDDLLQAFITVGVIADHHLRALLRLSARQREGFLDSIAPKYLTFVEKVEIADLLETHLDNTATGLRPAKIQVVSIPRPPEGLVNVLGQHTCSYVHIKKHMRIADDNEYFDIVDYIESEIPRFLEVEKPIEEQDDLDVQALLESVCEAWPSMRKYADCWPIFVHVSRFLDARQAGLPGTPRNAPPPRHECPRQRMYPAADVPPSVKALLADYGMDELGPAFLFLGVQTDEKFGSMVASEKARSRFLAGVPPLQLGCSAFQGIMMRYIIERV